MDCDRFGQPVATVGQVCSFRPPAKAAVQVHLTAIAYNLKRTMNILAAQA